MEISYKKDGINNYMIIRNQKDVENDYKLQMLINNKIEGILSINIKKINNENQFYYDITSKNSMRSLFVKNKVGAKDIEQFINSMAIVAKSMKEYLLDINNIVFDMDMIYWDSKKKVYNFCYYPFTEQGMKEGLNGLFLELLERLNHNDREAVVIGYGLQQKIISENFTITELKEYVAENIKMPGNNINKYSYEKAKKSNYYNEKQNDDLEDLDNIIEEAKEKGYVETLFHRRRYITELSSNNYMVRQFGARAAMNTPIQGTAADIMKIAMINVYNKLKEQKLDAKLILQIHDELIIECKEGEKEIAKKILQDCMENVTKLEIPLKVEVSEAKNWYDAK